jgi:general secretion pathway protein F
VRYELKTVGADRRVSVLALDAMDGQDARRIAQMQGYTVLAIRPLRSLSHRPLSWVALKRRARFPLTLFSQELLALLDAGLTLVEAMETLLEKEHRPESKQILRQVVKAIYEGHPLSHALEQFPAHFPPLYVATVRASEKTGDLGESLSRYVAYQEQMDIVRKKIVSASIYPVLLLVAGALVTLFLMVYVVPSFSGIYEEIGGDLPILSQWLLRWGQLLEAHGTPILGGFALACAALGYAATRPAARRWVAHKLWQIPALGERMRIYQLARFYRTLGMLLRGGTPAVSALGMASGLLPPALRDQLNQAAASVREGKSISQSMEHHGLTTPVALRMLRVGERTGKMGEMMGRIATFYDEEMARWVDWFTKLFEPLLMAFIGLVIGGIVVLMYFPIFEVAGSIQ